MPACFFCGNFGRWQRVINDSRLSTIPACILKSEQQPLTKFVPANDCDPDVTPNCNARGEDVYRAEYHHYWVLSSGQWAIAQISDPCDSKVAEILQEYDAREEKPDAAYVQDIIRKIGKKRGTWLPSNSNDVWTPYAPMRAKQPNRVDWPEYQEQENTIDFECRGCTSTSRYW